MGFQDILAGIGVPTRSPRAIRRGVVVILMLTLAAAGGVAYCIFARGTSPDRPSLMCVTPGCGYHTRRRLRVGEVLPLSCPRCGKRSVYGTHPCKHCGTVVVLNEQRGLPGPTHCPHCGQEVQHGR